MPAVSNYSAVDLRCRFACGASLIDKTAGLPISLGQVRVTLSVAPHQTARRCRERQSEVERD
jgi:hypothetical protein